MLVQSVSVQPAPSSTEADGDGGDDDTASDPDEEPPASEDEPPTSDDGEDPAPDGPVCPSDVIDQMPFTDVPVGGPHARDIACMAWWKLLRGRADGTFRPLASATRGQTAQILARILDMGGAAEGPSSRASGFDDVDGAFESAIARLVDAGIARGYGDGTFRPGHAVTRAEAVALLRRTHEAMTGTSWHGTGTTPFVDATGVHADSISWAAELGIADGHVDGTFRGHEPVRRAQVAAFLRRFVAVLAHEGTVARP